MTPAKPGQADTAHVARNCAHRVPRPFQYGLGPVTPIRTATNTAPNPSNLMAGLWAIAITP
jgi:hypothetical protein